MNLGPVAKLIFDVAMARIDEDLMDASQAVYFAKHLLDVAFHREMITDDEWREAIALLLERLEEKK